MVKSNPIKETKEIWAEVLHNSVAIEPLKPILETLPELIVDSNCTAFTVFNLKTFSPEYISSNLEDILGYSAEELMHDNYKIVFDNLSPEHQKLPKTLSEWLIQNIEKIPYEERQQMRLAYCGFGFRHKEKGLIRLLVQKFIYEVNEDQFPIRIFITLTDISHLLKGNTFWCRMQYGNSKKTSAKSYDYLTGVTITNDVISIREKEVLRYLAKGMETPEIAKTLYISPLTVNNHRQHMLNKLGAKDMTALVQLCLMCDII